MQKHVESDSGSGDTEEFGNEHQMGRAGDGEELSHSLHHTEYQSFEDRQVLAVTFRHRRTDAAA